MPWIEHTQPPERSGDTWVRCLRCGGNVSMEAGVCDCGEEACQAYRPEHNGRQDICEECAHRRRCPW